jgi:hypothetical protein
VRRRGGLPSLEDAEPALAAEWHPEKNGVLRPCEVAPASNKRAWWRCRRDATHVWDAVINSRLRGSGCPFCSGRRATRASSLAARAPALAAEWHPERNGALGPHEVGPSSGQKVWWQCALNPAHAWEATVVARAARGGGCPLCSSFAERYPELAAEWHPEKNGELRAVDVRPFSKRRVWWRCPRDAAHAWQAVVEIRVASRSGCPFCAGKRASASHSFESAHPRLAREWHPENNGAIGPRDVPPGARRVVWWRCPEGHEYEASVRSRHTGSGCPYCSGHRFLSERSLAALHPEVAAEWHPTRNGTLTAADVTAGVTRKVWWLCRASSHHAWRAGISQRAHGSRCPFCTGLRAAADNSLAALHHDLASEWHPEKNGALSPDAVTPGSAKMVWWRCPSSRNHDYQAAVAWRTHGRGCPFCAGKRACPDNSLRALFPAVAREWHPTKNGARTPDDVTHGSSFSAWWRCEHNEHHVWRTTVNARTNHGSGCPTCAGRDPKKRRRKRPKLRVPILI